jgi:hypothetical protein
MTLGGFGHRAFLFLRINARAWRDSLKPAEPGPSTTRFSAKTRLRVSIRPPPRAL